MGQRARMSSAHGKRGSYTTAPRPPQNVLGLLRAGEEARRAEPGTGLSGVDSAWLAERWPHPVGCLTWDPARASPISCHS